MVTRAETFRVGPCTWSSSCERGCGAPHCCANSKASAQTRVDNAPAGDGCLLWENRKSGDCACIASGEQPVFEHVPRQIRVVRACSSHASYISHVSSVHVVYGRRLLLAAGPIESASHTETTVMQLVQAAIIRAQVCMCDMSDHTFHFCRACQMHLPPHMSSWPAGNGMHGRTIGSHLHTLLCCRSRTLRRRTHHIAQVRNLLDMGQ